MGSPMMESVTEHSNKAFVYSDSNTLTIFKSLTLNQTAQVSLFKIRNYLTCKCTMWFSDLVCKN